MVRRFARLLLALGLVLWGYTSPVAPVAAGAAGIGAAGGGGGAAAITNSIADLTNVERSRAGLAPLRVEGRLMRAAQMQAEQMASLGRMDHVLRDGPYPAPTDRLAAAGYKW
ncbi:MAG TPA: CAP domain-containing protein, partial [Gemmatimonadaceae bacterium]|nr:CAP domain-containing protein [Gemmatimonadaceae bacterium]